MAVRREGSLGQIFCPLKGPVLRPTAGGLGKCVIDISKDVVNVLDADG